MLIKEMAVSENHWHPHRFAENYFKDEHLTESQRGGPESWIPIGVPGVSFPDLSPAVSGKEPATL